MSTISNKGAELNIEIVRGTALRQLFAFPDSFGSLSDKTFTATAFCEAPRSEVALPCEIVSASSVAVTFPKTLTKQFFDDTASWALNVEFLNGAVDNVIFGKLCFLGVPP
jgi:hypothetical protein